MYEFVQEVQFLGVMSAPLHSTPMEVSKWPNRFKNCTYKQNPTSVSIMITRIVVFSVVAMTATLAFLDSTTNASSVSATFSGPFDIPPYTQRRSAEDSPNLRTLTQPSTKPSAPRVPRTPEEFEQEEIARSRRIAERRANARAKIASIRPEPSSLEYVSNEDVERAFGDAKIVDPFMEKDENQWLRNLGLFGGNRASYGDPYQPAGMANPGVDYGTSREIHTFCDFSV